MEDETIKLWTDDITVLFKNMDKFWPDRKTSTNTQINATSRYIFYTSSILALYYRYPLFIVFGFITMVVTTTVWKKNSKVPSKPKNHINTCKFKENSVPFDEQSISCNVSTKNITNKNCNSISTDPLNHKKLEKIFYKVPEQDTTKFQNFMFSDMSKKTNDYYKGYGGYGN